MANFQAVGAMHVFELQVARHPHDLREYLFADGLGQVLEFLFPDLVDLVGFDAQQPQVLSEEPVDGNLGVGILHDHKL